ARTSLPRHGRVPPRGVADWHLRLLQLPAAGPLPLGPRRRTPRRAAVPDRAAGEPCDHAGARRRDRRAGAADAAPRASLRGAAAAAGARPPPGARCARRAPLDQRVPSLRADDARAQGGGHRGLGRPSHLARVRAVVRAGRRRPCAAVRGAAPATGRLPDVVPPARRPRARALVPAPARPHAPRAVGGRPAVRPQSVSRDAAPLPSRGRVSLPLLRRCHAAGHRSLVDARAGGCDPADWRGMPRRAPNRCIARTSHPGKGSIAMGGPAPTPPPPVRGYPLEEFWDLEPPPDGGHYELIGGVLYMVPQPDIPHSLAASNLVTLLVGYQQSHPGTCRLLFPRAGVQKTPDTWVEPDLMLVT